MCIFACEWVRFPIFSSQFTPNKLIRVYPSKLFTTALWFAFLLQLLQFVNRALIHILFSKPVCKPISLIKT